VAETHGKSLEVAIALPKGGGNKVNFDADTAQRYLLGSGDQFFVPPHNVYRLENHSEKKAAKLFWAIIKVCLYICICVYICVCMCICVYVFVFHLGLHRVLGVVFMCDEKA
jgi:hypothetical protein